MRVKKENKVEKKRLFYIDFIRAIATVLIVITHYNALYIYNVYRPNMGVGTTFPFHVYIGGLGVSLFLIISGASLMCVYKEKKLKLKEFYVKRVKRIFPMFWIAYLLVFCISMLNYGIGFINPNIPKFNYIYTFLGIDGYISNFKVQTFYLVGEWFLGFILLFYVVFPFILYIVKKFPKIVFILTVIIYFASVYLLRNVAHNDIIFPVRLLEIVFGMYFVYYNWKVKWYVALVCLVFLIINQVFNIQVNPNIKLTFVGISAFSLLTYISYFFEKFNVVNKFCNLICDYSYACFIIHHWVIFRVVSKIDLWSVDLPTSYAIFVAVVVAVCVSSYVLKTVTDKITKFASN